jgi:hypothetical protein
VLRAFDQILDARAQPTGSGAGTCGQALADAAAQFGPVETRSGLQLPSRLADDLSAISRAPLRDAMLQAIDARTRVLQLCAAENFQGAIQLEDRLPELDAAVLAAKRAA